MFVGYLNIFHDFFHYHVYSFFMIIIIIIIVIIFFSIIIIIIIIILLCQWKFGSIVCVDLYQREGRALKEKPQ